MKPFLPPDTEVLLDKNQVEFYEAVLNFREHDMMKSADDRSTNFAIRALQGGAIASVHFLHSIEAVPKF